LITLTPIKPRASRINFAATEKAVRETMQDLAKELIRFFGNAVPRVLLHSLLPSDRQTFAQRLVLDRRKKKIAN